MSTKSIVFNQKNHENDILLLRDVVSLNPFADGNIWAVIAGNMNALLKPKKEATVRTIRERMILLLKKFRSDERESLKKSGTDEDFGEYEMLLNEASDLQYESEQKKVEEKDQKGQSKHEKNQMEKRNMAAGRAIRDAAMDGLKSKKNGDSTDESSDSDTDNESVESSETDGEKANKENNRKRKRNKKTPGSTKNGKDRLFALLERKINLDEKKEKRRKLEVEFRREESNRNFKLLTDMATSKKEGQ